MSTIDRKPHWSETAERVYDGRLLIGEGDDGRFYVRQSKRADDPMWWAFRPWNPRHVVAWVHSRLSRKLVMLDSFA